MKTKLLIIIGVALTFSSLSFSQVFSETIHTFEYTKIGCDMLAIDQIQSVLEEKKWIKTTLDECVKRGLITSELVELGATVWGHSTRELSIVYGLTHGDIEKTIQLLQDPNYPINVFGSPYKQVSIGIEPENVLCKDGLELIFKSKDNSPACVKPESIPKLIERGWGISNNWIKISNAERVLNYELDMGKIISIHAFSEYKNPSLPGETKDTSLKIKLDSEQEGVLEIVLPRDLIDAKISNLDDDFFVLVDGIEIEYQETKTDATRTLIFHFPAKTEMVEILGYGYYNSELSQFHEPNPEPELMSEEESIQQKQAKLQTQKEIMMDYRGNQHQIDAINEYREEFESGYFLEQFILSNKQNYEKDDLINFIFVEWGYQPQECTFPKVEVFFRPYENYDKIEKISEWQKPKDNCFSISSDSDGYLIVDASPNAGIVPPHETCTIPGEYRVAASNLEDESKKEYGYFTCQKEKLVGNPQPWMELPE